MITPFGVGIRRLTGNPTSPMPQRQIRRRELVQRFDAHARQLVLKRPSYTQACPPASASVIDGWPTLYVPLRLLADDGAGVRMGCVENKPLAWQAGEFFKPLADGMGRVGRLKSDEVASDDDGAMAGRIFDRQRLRPDVLRDGGERPGPVGKAKHDDRFVRRDLHRRGAGLPLPLGCTRRRGERRQCQCREEQCAERLHGFTLQSSPENPRQRLIRQSDRIVSHAACLACQADELGDGGLGHCETAEWRRFANLGQAHLLPRFLDRLPQIH